MIRRLILVALLTAAAVPARAQTRAACGGAGQARCITVAFEETEMYDVAATFAEFSGYSVILSDGVTGRVTATVRAQPWDVAFRAILEAYGYGVRQVGPGILRVDRREAAIAQRVQAPLVTRVIRINYVPAAEVAASLEAVRTERGKITVSPSTNSLLVTDTEEAVAAMVRLVGHP
ncbi:MAG TPA: secretin N-terminal domain-containing protein [Longimicrobium sp.]|nr:secretin N-terminal domain-containing protein [Longimicrobium sp.]